jgi:DNA-binding CsgD family transcriptional regulator
LSDEVIDPEAGAGMTRAELYLRAADALFATSQSRQALTLADSALETLSDGASPEQRALILVRIGHINSDLQQEAAETTAYEQAAALVADRPPSRDKAFILAVQGGFLMAHDRTREAEPVLREAIAVADPAEANEVIAGALSSLGCVVVDLGRAEEGLASLTRSVQLSREYGSTTDVCRSYMNLTDVLIRCGRCDEADYHAQEGIAYALDAGQTSFSIKLTGNRIGALFGAGRWREAERVYAQVRAPGSGTDPWLHGVWVSVLIGQGRVDEARSIIDDLLTMTADTVEVQFRADVFMRAGEFAALETRWDSARDLLAQGLALCRATDDTFYGPRGYGGAIRVERRRIASTAGRRGAAGTTERARQVADELIAEARDFARRCAARDIALLPEPAAWLHTAEAEYAAIRGEDTAQMWADLVDTWESVGQPYRTAEAQYQEADALLRQRGDRDRARRCAAEALEVAERLGAAPLEKEIRQLIQRARLDVQSAPIEPEPVPGLDITAREAEVLKLLATGRTNREIAKALFISEKTASVHVSHLLRKLGVGSRVEAAAVAQRLELSR